PSAADLAGTAGFERVDLPAGGLFFADGSGRFACWANSIEAVLRSEPTVNNTNVIRKFCRMMGAFILNGSVSHP
ncbi:MAG: hypothetical protein WCH39_26020, partial [Schlesneria sp.]